MRRPVLAAYALAVLALAQPNPAAAQQEGFTKGYMDVGPVLGLGGLGPGSTLAVGGRFEAGVASFDVGTLGVQGSFDYYGLDYGVFGDASYTAFAVTANYHFAIPNQPKIDPFAGVGIGVARTGFNCGRLGLSNCDASDSFIVGHGGIRYFWKPNMAAYADVGVGAASLNVGLMFKLK